MFLKSEYSRLCCVSEEHTSDPRRNHCCFWRRVKRLWISPLFPHSGGRSSFTLAHLWVFTPPHQWLVWEHPLAEERIQFQSSMADYSWQGLTSSCQHWSYNRCFVSSTLQSLKDKTVFSVAQRELLLAATPLFSHYRSQLESCYRLPPDPRNSVFLEGRECRHLRQKVGISNLTLYLCCPSCAQL